MVGCIDLVPWTARWAEAFEVAALEIRHTLTVPVLIEHIGSTAVGGLDAKPMIDVLVGVSAPTDLCSVEAALRARSYKSAESQHLDQAIFLQKAGDLPTNLHLTTIGSVPWQDLIGFRDRLIASSDTRTRYAALKRRLARSSGGDLDRYTAEKSAFVSETLRPHR